MEAAFFVLEESIAFFGGKHRFPLEKALLFLEETRGSMWESICQGRGLPIV